MHISACGSDVVQVCCSTSVVGLRSCIQNVAIVSCLISVLYSSSAHATVKQKVHREKERERTKEKEKKRGRENKREVT